MKELGMDSDSHLILCKQCCRWIKRLPPTFEFNDLYNEGWIVHQKCLTFYNGGLGTKYTTLYWAWLENRFADISKHESIRNKREAAVDDEFDCQDFAAPADSLLMLKQFIDAVSLIYPSIADMVVNGIPEELFTACRKQTRVNRHKRGWDVVCGEFRLNIGMVEKFFGVSLKKLRPMFYNRVERLH